MNALMETAITIESDLMSRLVSFDDPLINLLLMSCFGFFVNQIYN